MFEPAAANKKQSKMSPAGCSVVIISIAIIIGIFWYFGREGDKPESQYKGARKYNETNYVAESTPKSSINDLVIKKSNWHIGGFGTVGLASFRIKNEGIKIAYDITIRMIFYGESGTELSRSQKLVTIAIPPGKTKKTGEINFGFINQQSKTASSEIVNANFK